MSAHSPIILLLEDCPVTGMLIERSILQSIPDARLVWCRSVEDAARRAAGLPIELFVIDISLPDGSGLDFLVKMSELHPWARAIVITASSLPEYQANSAALGVLHFLQKPVKPADFVNQVRVALASEVGDQERSDFSATLRNVTPMDILQFKCLAGETTAIEFKSAGRNGLVHLQSGEIAHASTGVLTGIDAVYEIVSWKRGTVLERTTVTEVERTIHAPWQMLLMEAAQRLDERAVAAA